MIVRFIICLFAFALLNMNAHAADPNKVIRTAKQSLDGLILMKEELGVEWTKPDRYRIGASSLLADIERQLEHHVTGRYAAYYRQPMA